MTAVDHTSYISQTTEPPVCKPCPLTDGRQLLEEVHEFVTGVSSSLKSLALTFILSGIIPDISARATLINIHSRTVAERAYYVCHTWAVYLGGHLFDSISQNIIMWDREKQPGWR